MLLDKTTMIARGNASSVPTTEVQDVRNVRNLACARDSLANFSGTFTKKDQCTQINLEETCVRCDHKTMHT